MKPARGTGEAGQRGMAGSAPRPERESVEGVGSSSAPGSIERDASGSGDDEASEDAIDGAPLADDDLDDELGGEDEDDDGDEDEPNEDDEA